MHKFKIATICTLLLAIAVLSCKKDIEIPSVSIPNNEVCIEIGYSTAIISIPVGSIDDDGIHARVVLADNQQLTGSTIYPMTKQDKMLVCSISNLEHAQMYYFCFELFNSVDVLRDTVIHSFTTKDFSSPMVVTLEPSDITYGTAKCGGKVIDNGGNEIISKGFCWCDSPNPSFETSHIDCGGGDGEFYHVITGLEMGHTYYVCTYAINSVDTSYGAVIAFTTMVNTGLVVTTTAPTGITATDAVSGGSVTADGANPVTARGVCWSTSPHPTFDGEDRTVDGLGSGAFTSNLHDLVRGTTYYIRAYATNNLGVTYGEELTFTTLPLPPTVSTIEAFNISNTSASAGGVVSDDGGAEVTARGICYSIYPNVSLISSQSHTTPCGSGGGDFEGTMYGLSELTTYYYCAYATNTAGTSYGEVLPFTTRQMALSHVHISSYGSILSNGQGNYYWNATVSGLEISEKGFVWSTYGDPLLSGNTVNDTICGSGEEAFSLIISSSQLYGVDTVYVRAYAINPVGTSYSTLTKKEIYNP